MKFSELGQAKKQPVPTQTMCGKYLLPLLTYKWAGAISVGPDRGPSDRVHCLPLRKLYMQQTT